MLCLVLRRRSNARVIGSWPAVGRTAASFPLLPQATQLEAELAILLVADTPS